jgi:hypothetical protein
LILDMQHDWLGFIYLVSGMLFLETLYQPVNNLYGVSRG